MFLGEGVPAFRLRQAGSVRSARTHVRADFHVVLLRLRGGRSALGLQHGTSCYAALHVASIPSQATRPACHAWRSGATIGATRACPKP